MMSVEKMVPTVFQIIFFWAGVRLFSKNVQSRCSNLFISNIGVFRFSEARSSPQRVPRAWLSMMELPSVSVKRIAAIPDIAVFGY